MDNAPKIAVITNICPHYRKNLFEKLDKIYNVEFLFFSDSKTPYWESKNKIDLGDFNGRYLKGFWWTRHFRITPSLITEIVRGKHDIIIQGIGGKFAVSIGFILAKLLRKKFILWTGLWHHPKTFFHRLSYPLAKFLYRRSDAILAYGNHVREYLVSLGVREERIFIATQAVNNALFNKRISEDEKRSMKEYLKLYNNKVILYVGQLEHSKGVYYLLEAVSGINMDGVCLLMIGRGSQYGNLREMARKRDLKNVLFLGYIDNTELYRYYAIADVFVLPSIETDFFKEPWGLVINEAMNQGCPIVATVSVGAAAGGLVQDGINGLIVRERSSMALREAIERILESERIRQSMRGNSKKNIERWTDDKRLEGFVSSVNFVSNNSLK